MSIAVFWTSPTQGKAHAPASEAVTAVTDLHYGYPIIFWTPCAAARDLAGRKSRPCASLVQGTLNEMMEAHGADWSATLQRTVC